MAQSDFVAGQQVFNGGGGNGIESLKIGQVVLIDQGVPLTEDKSIVTGVGVQDTPPIQESMQKENTKQAGTDTVPYSEGLVITNT